MKKMSWLPPLTASCMQKPKLNRNIFVRRYYHLYAIRDIADAYGMSESKVTSLLFRMRNELRRFLEKEGIML